MNLVLGVGTLSLTALLFGWAFGAHRRPVPARWTQTPASMLMCVALVELFALGVGFLLMSGLSPIETVTTVEPVSAIAAAVLLGASVFLTPRFVATGRVRQSADIIPLNPMTPPVAPRPVSGTRRRAA